MLQACLYWQRAPCSTGGASTAVSHSGQAVVEHFTTPRLHSEKEGPHQFLAHVRGREENLNSSLWLLQVFAAEFAGGWLGFWTAPQVLSYGLIWSNFPGGTWEYRWGDQQFWKSALGIFDDGSHVEDVSYVRWAHPHH